MSASRVTVKAPATTANLGPGFDVFGLALEKPSDKITVSAASKGFEIKVRGLFADTIPTAPEKNTAGVVANQILGEFGLESGLVVEIDKGIIPGVGLGSSAAPAAAVAFALNRLFHLNLDYKELIRFAAKGEFASAGSEHADNVAAAICGNFVIVQSYKPLEIINLECPPDMEVCVAFPKIVTVSKTEKARSIVSKMVPIDKVVHNVGMAAALASGFAMKDVDLIGRSMDDSVVEPARASLIPGYDRVRANAFKAGACGVAVSGAGPAMMAVVNKNKADSKKVANAMMKGFESVGLEADAFATRPGVGVSLLEEK